MTLSVDGLRDGIDRLIGFDKIYPQRTHFPLHALEVGFALFTPRDITDPNAQPNDHPYGSLFFLANSKQTVVPSLNRSYQSVLTVGFLGLKIAKGVQNTIHGAIGSEKAQGWQHQISAGGEPTARYMVGLQQTLLDSALSKRLRHEFKVTAEADIGFTTGASVGFSYRLGRIATPWWSFNPHQAEYVNLGSPAATSRRGPGNEAYVYVGATAKYRFYNALLQGQFRNSAVTFDRNDLKEAVFEMWAGVTYEFKSRWRITAFVRTRSAEIDIANGASRPVWGGFVVSRAL
jgi:hypothetical protein